MKDLVALIVFEPAETPSCSLQRFYICGTDTPDPGRQFKLSRIGLHPARRPIQDAAFFFNLNPFVVIQRSIVETPPAEWNNTVHTGRRRKHRRPFGFVHFARNTILREPWMNPFHRPSIAASDWSGGDYVSARGKETVQGIVFVVVKADCRTGRCRQASD